jgi:7-cyano-7-deazaguanine synthase
MSRAIAVVCLSGGMDSCVTAAIAARSHELACLHVNYGQRTEGRELRSFRDIADFYRVEKRLVVELPHLARIGGSSLTDKSRELPAARLARKQVPSTYVPFRNANILSAAVAWAEALGAHAVFIGAVEVDSSGYPDCRAEFFDTFAKAVSLGTRPGSGIEIVTPVIAMSKADIVRKGVELGAPLHLTWSCYSDETVACGGCDSCLLRMRAFAEAGVPDPIPRRGAV